MQDSAAVSTNPTDTHFSRVLRPLRATPADVVRPTRAEIDLASLRHNFAVLQKRSTSPVWPVIKADGYGHGAKAIARTLERAGATGFCVALVEEAIELREAGVFAPIVVMGGYYRNAYEELLHRSVTPVVADAGTVEALADEARHLGVAPVAVHLKVDTGMGRLGATPNQVPEIAAAIRNSPFVELDGLMTHFACADTDPESVHEQMVVFDRVRQELAREGLVPRRCHAANTAAVLNDESTHLDMTRPGIGIFGVEPTSGACTQLRPVMKVRTEIVSLRTLAPGQSVGYGAQWTAERASTIATIPMGYADGLSRHLSNKGFVLVGGIRAPLVGIVSMDMATVDVTGLRAKLGDEVVVLGSQGSHPGGESITAAEIAEQAGTIPWEVLTNISRRVPRFYRER